MSHLLGLLGTEMYMYMQLLRVVTGQPEFDLRVKSYMYAIS